MDFASAMTTDSSRIDYRKHRERSGAGLFGTIVCSIFLKTVPSRAPAHFIGECYIYSITHGEATDHDIEVKTDFKIV